MVKVVGAVATVLYSVNVMLEMLADVLVTVVVVRGVEVVVFVTVAVVMHEVVAARGAIIAAWTKEPAINSTHGYKRLRRAMTAGSICSPWAAILKDSRTA